MSAARRARVVTKAKKFNIPLFLTVLNAVYTGLSNHTSQFPGLPVLLATFAAQILALETLQKEVKKKVPGAAGPRDDARDVCFSSLETIRAFVQGLCDQSPEQAATLASAAGMKIAERAARSKAVLAAKPGKEPGLVLLAANAGLLSKAKRQKVYEWMYSLDGGKTWIGVPSTPRAKTSIAGLPLLVAIAFRVRVNDSLAIGEWTLPTFITLH